jgi:hypothetical protein
MTVERQLGKQSAAESEARAHGAQQSIRMLEADLLIGTRERLEFVLNRVAAITCNFLIGTDRVLSSLASFGLLPERQLSAAGA